MTPFDDSPSFNHQQARIADLEAHLARLSTEVADLAAALAANTEPCDTPARPEDPKPVYDTATDWVEHYFCIVFARSIGGETRWCPRWAEHPEAVTRLNALWRSWETLRLDPNLGIATWLTSYADAQLPILLGRAGPFTQCSAERHQALQRLQIEDPTGLPTCRTFPMTGQ